jgi:hypothetical protein
VRPLQASFVLPIALGTAFFYWNPTAFTGNTVNYGEFVNPIITTIPDVKAIKRSLLDNMKADNENIKKLTLSAEKGNAIAQHNLSIE